MYSNDTVVESGGSIAVLGKVKNGRSTDSNFGVSDGSYITSKLPVCSACCVILR